MPAIESKSESRRKIWLYLISSSATGLLYLALLFIFSNVMRLNVVVAVTLTYVTSMAVYFVVNKLIVFRTLNSGKLGKEIFQFVVVSFLNYLITIAIVKSVYQFTQEAFSGTILSGIVTTIMTYFVFNKILFKKFTSKSSPEMNSTEGI